MSNADLTAYRRDIYLDYLRHNAVRDALTLIVDGEPDTAYLWLLDSVLGEQARMAGIRIQGQP